ncbi:MAG: hypothetical protein JSV88_16380 [Candidatus Aminicenantes bacterium]|nr:MAG: hypothetical protein JSV88_16380 [Candidatus Aminicenantes bacterium]
MKFKFNKDLCVVPARHLLPPIHTYTNTFIENILGRKMLVGNVETTRGCHHKCKFCSVYASSGTKVKFANPGTIMQDVDQLVKDGSHLNLEKVPESKLNMERGQAVIYGPWREVKDDDGHTKGVVDSKPVSTCRHHHF